MTDPTTADLILQVMRLHTGDKHEGKWLLVDCEKCKKLFYAYNEAVQVAALREILK